MLQQSSASLGDSKKEYLVITFLKRINLLKMSGQVLGRREHTIPCPPAAAPGCGWAPPTQINPPVCPEAAALLSSISSGLALPWWASPSTTVTQEGGEFHPWDASLYLCTPGMLHSTKGPVVHPKML